MIKRVVSRTFGLQRGSLAEKERAIPLSEAAALRLLYFYEHLRTIQHIEGTIVECGVGWGRSLFAFAACQRALGQERRIFGFDSFEGFPDPSAEDLPGKARRGHYKTNRDSVVRFLINSGLSRASVDSSITLVPGFFADSMRTYDAGPVALLHLDVDIYSSYKETLQFFYPRVPPGGIIAFDEYQSLEKYPGARKAIDEFFGDKPERLRRSPIIDRYFTVKE